MPSLPELCGGGAILEHTESIGFTNHQHLLFEGADHVPWELGGESQDQMIDFVSTHLYNDLDCMNVGVNEITSDEIQCYPNPTKDVFNFTTQQNINHITVFTLNGTQVAQAKNTKSISIEHLPKGIYMVELTTQDLEKSYLRVVKM